MERHERMAIDEALATTAHRPWPMPRAPWLMYQRWERLLFAHWPVDAAELRRHVPAQLPIDEHDGTAWITIAPFDLAALRGRGIPARVSFPELNVRTYVRVNDKPGVYFFSLDAASALAVTGGRLVYGLPYFPARMSIARQDDWVRYVSERGRAIFEARYRPVGDVFIAQPGTRDHFLAERYALYAVRGPGLVQRTDVHHAPWRLQRAELEITRNTMLEVAGLRVGDATPVLQYSERQDVLVWAPSKA
jgi:uncharacterized protein YqjF (DUF2071 family)